MPNRIFYRPCDTRGDDDERAKERLIHGPLAPFVIFNSLQNTSQADFEASIEHLPTQQRG